VVRRLVVVRGVLTTVVEIVGLAAVAAGFWLISPAFGLIAAGGALVALGVALA
jgi:hypothetical protein